MAVSNWEWLNGDKALSCYRGVCACCPVLKVSTILLGAKQRFNKERFQVAGDLQSGRCSPVVTKVLAARMRKLITARARKNKRTARMLANARKDHSIPLTIKANKIYNISSSKILFKKVLKIGE